MTVDEIMKGIRTIKIEGSSNTDVLGISYDSRKTAGGHLFVAMAGEHADGHLFIPQAIEKGAVAVMFDNLDPDQLSALGTQFSGVTFIQVTGSREALAAAANNFYAHPSSALHLVGVTGTNGKTTTTYLIKSVLEKWGRKTGLIGTISYMVGTEVYASSHTTPESPEFQGLLHDMLKAGCTHVISEVSSHALAQKRVDGSNFRTVVFTNLTRDHLDFHDSMDDYFLAKERLFRQMLSEDGQAVINMDDQYGRKLLSSCRSGYTYGLDAQADIRARDIRNLPGGLRFTLDAGGGTYNVESPMIGIHNVYNILAAIGSGLAMAVPMDVILEGIRSAGSVRGRFERIDEGQRFIAVVDYAHTEDALERTILTARELTRGRLITVFGCGGDRDKGKRPGMGAVATRLSDVVIITSDNPRSEDPGAIIREVEAGAARKNYLVEPDREEAIRRGVEEAREGDLLLVAGKGHEEYQEIGGKRYDFSDSGVLRKMIRDHFI